MRKVLSLLAICFAVVALNAQASFPYEEGFENGFGQWEVQSSSSYTWGIGTDQTDGSAHTGSSFANCTYDEDLNVQDEKLISPTFDFTNMTNPTLSFWCSLSYYWGVDPNPNYHLVVAVSTDGGASYSDIWDSQTIGEYENFEYFQATPDISNVAGQSNVKFRFSYLGQDGAQIMLDDIQINAEPTTAIAENAAANVNIFPNPATTVLNVEAAGYDNIQIVNVLGQVVYSASVVDNMQVNVSNLDNGVYFVRLNGENGTATQKFIKK